MTRTRRPNRPAELADLIREMFSDDQLLSRLLKSRLLLS